MTVAARFWEDALICRRGMARTREPKQRRESKDSVTGGPERRYEPSGGYEFRWTFGLTARPAA